MRSFTQAHRYQCIVNMILVLSICFLFLLSGCSKTEEIGKKEVGKKLRFVIVLVGETGSFDLPDGADERDRCLFSISNNIDRFEDELNRGDISEEFKRCFLENRMFLPERSMVERVSNTEWRIEDYLIKKGRGRLDVYFTSFWPEIPPLIDEIVKRLQPGERFGVIGIDKDSSALHGI